MGAEERGPQRSPEYTPEGWDAVTDGYEAAAPIFVRKYGLALLDVVEPGPGDHLLDVACGPGVVALEAARRGATVTAVDFSPRMVERCREHADEEGLDVRAAVMDGQQLELGDDAFDVAVSNFGVIFFPHRARGVAELNRVVRPGGRVAVSVWSTPDRLGFMQVFGEAVRRTLPDPPNPPPPDWLAVATPDGLRALLAEGGLAGVEVRTVTEHTEAPSATWFRDQMTSISPAGQAMLDRLPSHARQGVLDATVTVLTERFGEQPIRLPAEAHLGLGVATA